MRDLASVLKTFDVIPVYLSRQRFVRKRIKKFKLAWRAFVGELLRLSLTYPEEARTKQVSAYSMLSPSGALFEDSDFTAEESAIALELLKFEGLKVSPPSNETILLMRSSAFTKVRANLPTMSEVSSYFEEESPEPIVQLSDAPIMTRNAASIARSPPTKCMPSVPIVKLSLSCIPLKYSDVRLETGRIPYNFEYLDLARNPT